MDPLLVLLMLSECFFEYNIQGPRPNPLESRWVMEEGPLPRLRGTVSEDGW